MQRAGTTATPTPVGEVAIARDDDDARLLAELRGGSEAAYVCLINRYHTSLVRLARLYVHAGVAEDVVQETWIRVMRGLERFEGRASFKTWLFRILVNRARTRGARDARAIDLSSIVQRETESDDPAVEPSRFRAFDDPYPGHWLLTPAADEMPEEQLLADEFSEHVRNALLTLPPAQAEVVRLRDVEGLTSDEVCELLNISEGNQRVLLHRGRSKIRGILEDYIASRRDS